MNLKKRISELEKRAASQFSAVRRPALTALCTLILSTTISSAQTWLLAPATNNWNTATNWVPANVPDSAGETAVFDLSAVTNPTVTSAISIEGITFNALAPAYVINMQDGIALTGPGIVNNSASVQTIENNGSALLEFFNAASAANVVINNSSPISVTNFFDNATAATATINNTNPTALLNFLDNSSAGSATINNSASGPFPSSVVSFFANATAANATIKNTGDNSQTFFGANSTAGSAGINNDGSGSSTVFTGNSTAANAFISNGGDGALLEFKNQSTAGSATLINGGVVSAINFFDTTTAANATINNVSATALLNFLDNSSAGNATIHNNASGPFPSSVVSFFANATAANATIANSGDNTQTFFGADSAAGFATITNNGSGSSTVFTQRSTAGNAAITSNGDGALIEFKDQSTAGSATLNNNGLVSSINFFDNATAAAATINNTSPTALLNFLDNSTAGNATINNSASGPFPSAVVSFFGNATAANATIANSGDNTQTFFGGSSTAANSTITNSGAGSSTVFTGNATGGTSVLINANPTAFIDISQLTTSGISVGSVAGNGALFLGSKNLTVGSANTSTTFSGIIQDGGFGGGIGGSLTKVGSGTFILSGANTFSGGTELQSGTLVVASDRALGNGSFQLTGGILKANGPTRDINVRGSYTQTGGELDLRIGGTAIGQFDRLIVLGSANLGGGLRVDAANGFKPEGGDSFTIITAGGGVNGQFQQLQDNLTQDTTLQLSISYLSNSVILAYLQGAFAPFALTPNQRAVANALDIVVNDEGASDLIGFLNTLPTSSLPAAFDLIAPEEIGAIFEISRSAAKMQAFAVEHRLDEIHGYIRPAPLESGLAKDGKTANEMKEVVSPEDRWGFFVNGSGEFVTVGDTFNARGYDFDSGGVTLGADYKFCEHFAAGVLLNYTRTRADLTGDGRIEADAFRGGIYASVFGGGAYLNAYLGGGYNDYDTRREGLRGTPRGSTDGGEFNALVAAGYDAHFGNLTIGPIASYQYTYMSYDGFREHGSLAPLRISSQNGESSRTNVGARMSYNGHVGSAVVTPEVRATWQHEFGDVEQATDARFDFGGPRFTVHSAEVGRDSLVLDAGIAVQFTPTFSAYGYYEGELGRTNYEAHNVIVGGRLSF